MSKVIVFATPVFLLLIALEFFWSRSRRALPTSGTNPVVYGLSDTINSISLGVLSQVAGVLSRVLTIGIYTSVFSSVALFPDTAFWTTPAGWVTALLFYDLCYYWLHRAGHRVAVCWAAHVVHHQSQHYNLSTALRQTSSGALLGWIFYLPMAIAGVPPMVFGIVAIIDLLYQFWVHTEQVGKLGWFDRVFCSPSNHRVHHAVNDEYIDRNYGGLLVIWDRLFGTFQEEKAPCVYGTRSPLESWDPLWANAEVYWALAVESWHAQSWLDKVRVWFMPPGWQSPQMAANRPKPAFVIAQVRPFNPPLSRAGQIFALVQFGLLLGAVSLFLWNAGTMSFQQSALWAVGIGAVVWAQGQMLQGRLAMLEVVLLECAVLATLASLPSMGISALFMALKPLPMVVAVIYVAVRARNRGGLQTFDRWLGGALLLSLGGDVFLMLPGNYFLPGLASFLLAHLCYLRLLKQGLPWFPHRKAAVVVGLCSATIYAVLWSHLKDPVLKLAVAAYVTVISAMAAQAIGRAMVLAEPYGRGVAAGAVIFMMSDTLIAVNKFVTPLTDASLWILGTYFAAQMLIVHHLRPVLPHVASADPLCDGPSPGRL